MMLNSIPISFPRLKTWIMIKISSFKFFIRALFYQNILKRSMKS